MEQPSSRRTPIVRPILVLIGLLALAGCQEDEITHSIVPRAAEPEKTRLVAVVYPHGDQTWFFKLMGPESGFDGVIEPFTAFMNTVHFAGKDDPPTWTKPDDWKQEEATKLVYAAFRVGSPDKPVKLTITMLPSKTDADMLLANVNRWRGQLGLEPVTEDGLKALEKDKQVQDLRIGDVDTHLVDMTGAGPHKQSAKGPVWTYQAPDGWVAAPHPEAGKIAREAVFIITDGDQKAEASVTALGGKAGGLESNVERWARQIDALAVEPDQLKQMPKITVADRDSPYVDLTGKQGRTLGAIVPYGDRTWFFKLTGPADLVEKQKTKFEAFLKSVKFEGGMGGEQ